MPETSEDTELNSDVPGVQELATTYLLAVTVWSPVLLAATGNLVPALELVSDYTLRPLLEITRQSFDAMAAPLSDQTASEPTPSTQTTTTTTPSPTTTPNPSGSQELSPAGLVLAGIIQLVLWGAGLLVVFGVVFMVIVGVVAYVILLFNSLADSFHKTRRFIAHHKAGR